jgi:hypothetical protein
MTDLSSLVKGRMSVDMLLLVVGIPYVRTLNKSKLRLGGPREMLTYFTSPVSSDLEIILNQRDIVTIK